MKARIKKTGEIIEVKSFVYSRLERKSKIIEEYNEDELEFLNKEEDKHWQMDDITDWDYYRVHAAIAAMQGIMNFFGSLDYNRETIARLAVEQANALIEELKKK